MVMFDDIHSGNKRIIVHSLRVTDVNNTYMIANVCQNTVYAPMYVCLIDYLRMNDSDIPVVIMLYVYIRSVLCVIDFDDLFI